MTIIDVVALPPIKEGDQEDGDLWKAGADRYDYQRLPAEIRNQAMLAQGTVVEGLTSAVRRVIEAGQALSWAKEKLPHGEYLPWVQQACGLKPSYAQQLIKAADWANAGHVSHLDGVTDVKTLFLLSADATPDDVCEWFMERCAAGDVPSRAEVTERKRRAAGKPAAPRPIEHQALTLFRKQQLEQVDAALALARQITTVADAAVLQEVGLRELPKGKLLQGRDADFHRRPDGVGWDRIPHAGRVDASPASDPGPAQDVPQQEAALSAESGDGEVMRLAEAAERVGLCPRKLTQWLVPSRNPDGFIRSGLLIARAGRGLVRLTPAT